MWVVKISFLSTDTNLFLDIVASDGQTIKDDVSSRYPQVSSFGDRMMTSPSRNFGTISFNRFLPEAPWL